MLNWTSSKHLAISLKIVYLRQIGVECLNNIGFGLLFIREIVFSDSVIVTKIWDGWGGELFKINISWEVIIINDEFYEGIGGIGKTRIWRKHIAVFKLMKNWLI
jgi:hypothetical protein